MIAPGKIVLEWNGQGRLDVSAPLTDFEEDFLVTMLAQAIKALAQHQAPLILPVTDLPASLKRS
jgi:hypothetical protein